MWRLYWKAQANWTWLLPPVGLGVAAAWLDLRPLFAYGLPLAAAFYLSGALVLDYDQDAAEVHLSYPQRVPLRLVLISAPRWGVWLGCGLLLLAVALLRVGTAEASRLAWLALPPAVGLTGAAAACAALVRREAGGFLAAGCWWVIDTLAPGMLNRNFYLFPLAHPLPGILPAVPIRNVLIAGVVLWGLALWLASRRERWLR